jgi:hypothetical protein
MLAIGSRPGFDDGALGSFDGSRRVTQCLQWAAPPARSSAACCAVSRAHACRHRADRRSLSAPFTRRRATRRASSTASACPLAASLTETELQHLPVRLVDASADVFFDPVLEEAFDEPALCHLRAVAGEAAGASRRHASAAARQIYVDVITLRNATTQRTHTFKIHLPPIAPQFIIDGERVPLAAALQVRIVVMLCTAAQSIAIKLSVNDESVGELAPIRVESELVDGARL